MSEWVPRCFVASEIGEKMSACLSTKSRSFPKLINLPHSVPILYGSGACFGLTPRIHRRLFLFTSGEWNSIRPSPFGNELGQGICELKGNAVVSIKRAAWQNPEPLVILYSLYQFAERAEVYSFTLTDLLADNFERTVLSPRILFGLNKEVLLPILQGLAADYRTFIRVDLNKGIMENIFLEKEKTTADVIELF